MPDDLIVKPSTLGAGGVSYKTIDYLVSQIVGIEGTTGDAAVAAGATGTHAAKLRRISTDIDAILTYVDGLEALLTTLNSYSDGVETLLTSIESDIAGGIGGASDATVSAGATGSLNAKVRRISTDMATLLTYVDGVETLLTALNGYVDGIEALLAPTTAWESAPTVTRPANTTPYTAGDVVGGVITFSSAGPSGGHVLITLADLGYDVNAVPVGMTTFRLHLYNATPPSAYADNAAWDLPSGDRSAYQGYIDLPTLGDLGSTLFCQSPYPGNTVQLVGTSIFGYLQTLTGYTPAANSEVVRPRLHTAKV